MKYLFALTVLLLAACGGGGGGITPPGPTPTVKPTATVYASKIVFVGALTGRQVQIQSDLRQVQDSSATPLPIMLVTPIAADGTLGGSPATSFGGTVQAVVSPAPSASPSVTFTTTDPNAVFGTPPPGTPAPGIIAQEPVTSNPSATNVQSAGVVQAAIGSPVNQTPQTPVYTYRAISLECPNNSTLPINAGSAPAWAWNGTGWATVSTIAQADIYMTGPHCNGAFNDTTESDTTIHYPGGGVTLSTDSAFSSLAASQWANTQTSSLITTLIAINPDGSQNAEILFKTQNGAVVKLFPNSIQTGTTPDFSGAIEVSGSSVDGF